MLNLASGLSRSDLVDWLREHVTGPSGHVVYRSRYRAARRAVRFILLLGEWPQVFKKKSNDFRVVASRVEGEKVLVASTGDHPQPFWLDGCTEQFFGLSECCVLVTRSCYDKDW